MEIELNDMIEEVLEEDDESSVENVKEELMVGQDLLDALEKQYQRLLEKKNQ